MLCGAPLVTVSSCAVDPLTGRRTLQLLPDDQLNQMGAQAYQQVLSENQGAVLPPSSPEAQLVERVGRRIAPVVDRQRIENGEQPFDWQFSVIDSQEANAFALPGGRSSSTRAFSRSARTRTGSRSSWGMKSRTRTPAMRTIG